MNPDNIVPKIDLSPKLKRPLSLWNPLDYLRLLYWVFYFPQALYWYKKTFENRGFLDHQSLQQYLIYLQQSSIQRNLILQSSFLLLILDFSLAKTLEILGFNIDWIKLTLGAMTGVIILFFSAERGIALGVTWGTVVGIISGVTNNVKNTFPKIFLIIFLFIALSAFLNEVFNKNLIARVTRNIAAFISIGITSFVFTGGILSVMVGMTSGAIIWMPVFIGAAFGIVAGAIFVIALLRIDDCFFKIMISCISRNSLYLWRISPVPISSLSRKIAKWLQKDWENGLFNANQILEYTSQFIAVSQAINLVLSTTPPESLLFRASLLAQQPFDWNIVKFASASWSDKLKFEFVDGLFIIPSFVKRKLTRNLSLELRRDTPARSAVAGFWYLHEQDPVKALQFFLELQSFPHGQEMCLLVETLMFCDKSILNENLTHIIAASPLLLLPSTPRLHPDSWLIINSFHQVISNIEIVKTSNSYTNKSLALNRALGQLDKILKQSSKIVTAEKDLIIKIATAWQNALLSVASEIGEKVILEPVISPYTIGDPVEGDAFVGRKDIINELAELWRQNKSVQSVVLYGHRRMGKTSILRNINRHLGKDVSLAYVNMSLVTNTKSETDILMLICDQIAITTGITAPTNKDFSDFPQTTCRRYIQEVVERIGQRRLIIALDEFEVIDDLINAQKIPPEFLAFLRGLVQISPNIAFAFAGLHTLEERIANYSDPFFASFIPIPVGFLSLGATRQLLANPADPDFPLDYTPETLDKIYQLTAGQPYLTQLVGFQLVRHYNNQVFEEGRTRDPMLTINDLNIVIQDPVFFDRGRYYFTGVWNQASQDIPHQQTILTALAPHPGGLSMAELITATNLSVTELTAALKILERHDVAAYDQEKWRISIELFRRWVIDRLYAQQS
jgi:AAA ATPase domain